jgi:hypothetical protein
MITQKHYDYTSGVISFLFMFFDTTTSSSHTEATDIRSLDFQTTMCVHVITFHKSVAGRRKVRSKHGGKWQHYMRQIQ